MICLNSVMLPTTRASTTFLAGGRINAGGQQLRGGEDRWNVSVYVLEATEVPTPDVALVGCHPTDVVRILGDEIAV